MRSNQRPRKDVYRRNVGVSLSDDVLDWLDTKAEKNERSRSWAIEDTLRSVMAQESAKKQKP